MKKPKILILDDSVSALDSTTEQNLRKALAEEFKNTTIFIITQRINSCKTADKILVMDDRNNCRRRNSRRINSK
mgnify:CR=1 FL=1